ncbi:WhiB family transcriptional regulator [Streptomyces sp. NBC_00316]|uniref:WhiB family transcriptional regulator n=1 Tax=Streptomyces sp. NBC_00316 TaxID=2975710 RepID=UPI002E290680|nr:WhiB family transcriptional regulator [Streptomyces sp. NBC_00316]
MHDTPNQSAKYRLRGDQTWQDHAACQPSDHHEPDPEWFFPEPDETGKIAAAKMLCAQCPVRRACLDAALETNDTFGIRGGLTEEERASLHTKMAARLDRRRVQEALAGRDVHLTHAERLAVIHTAYQQGIPPERLAWILQVTYEHAQKLYRAECRAHRNRDISQKNKNATSNTARTKDQPSSYRTAA